MGEEETQQIGDNMRRNMEFIVQQQAQFTVDIQKLRESQAQTERIVERLATVTLNRFEKVEGEGADRFENLESKMSALVDSHIRLADAQALSDEKMNALVDAQIRLSDSQKKTDERFDRLAESQTQSDERVNRLVESQVQNDERVNRLVESQVQSDERVNRLVESQARSDERVNKLADAQTQTDERLNAFIAAVERLVNERRNGK